MAAEAEVRKRARAGFAWLEENHPELLDRVDPQRLNVDDCKLCVLGQALGDYIYAVCVVLGLSVEEATRLGFLRETSSRASFEASQEESRMLDDEWKALLEGRAE